MGVGTREHVGTDLLAHGVDGVADLRHKLRHLLAAEGGPLGNGLRILRLKDVDTRKFLEFTHATLAVAAVRRRIRAVGEVQSVLVPQAARQDGVHVADVVQLDIVHLGDGGVFLDHGHDEVLHLGMRRVQGLVVIHIGRELVGTLAQAVHAVPVVGLPALEHAGLPGMVFQPELMGDLRDGRGVLHGRLDAHAGKTVGFPILKLGPDLIQVRILAHALPPVQRHGRLLFSAGDENGERREERNQ